MLNRNLWNNRAFVNALGGCGQKKWLGIGLYRAFLLASDVLRWLSLKLHCFEYRKVRWLFGLSMGKSSRRIAWIIWKRIRTSSLSITCWVQGCFKDNPVRSFNCEKAANGVARWNFSEELIQLIHSRCSEQASWDWVEAYISYGFKWILLWARFNTRIKLFVSMLVIFIYNRRWFLISYLQYLIWRRECY